MAAPATTTRTAVANTQLSAGKRTLVLRAFRRSHTFSSCYPLPEVEVER